MIREKETLQALAKCEGYAHHLAGAALGIVLVMAGAAGAHGDLARLSR